MWRTSKAGVGLAGESEGGCAEARRVLAKYPPGTWADTMVVWKDEDRQDAPNGDGTTASLVVVAAVKKDESKARCVLDVTCIVKAAEATLNGEMGNGLMTHQRWETSLEQ